MNRVCSSVQKCVLPLGLFVCLCLLGRCVYKLHYSKVQETREKRTHIHTGTAQCSESPIFQNLYIPKNSPPGKKFKYFKWHKTHTAFSLRSAAETLTGLSRI